MFTVPPEMLATYRKRRARDIAFLTQCLAKNRIEEFHRIGHQISGNARTFGLYDLEPIAKKMENLLPREFAKIGPAVLREFRQWFDANKM
jgi:HPt (histidine-containing phosphotransfer) domain-containing protein